MEWELGTSKLEGQKRSFFLLVGSLFYGREVELRPKF